MPFACKKSLYRALVFVLALESGKASLKWLTNQVMSNFSMLYLIRTIIYISSHRVFLNSKNLIKMVIYLCPSCRNVRGLIVWPTLMRMLRSSCTFTPHSHLIVTQLYQKRYILIKFVVSERGMDKYWYAKGANVVTSTPISHGRMWEEKSVVQQKVQLAHSATLGQTIDATLCRRIDIDAVPSSCARWEWHGAWGPAYAFSHLGTNNETKI